MLIRSCKVFVGEFYFAFMPQLRRLANTPVIFMKYSRLHSGGGTAENVAEFPSTAAVHVVIESPISSKSGLQVWVVVSPTDFPVSVLMPFTMVGGSSHSAAEQEVYE